MDDTSPAPAPATIECNDGGTFNAGQRVLDSGTIGGRSPPDELATGGAGGGGGAGGLSDVGGNGGFSFIAPSVRETSDPRRAVSLSCSTLSSRDSAITGACSAVSGHRAGIPRYGRRRRRK